MLTEAQSAPAAHRTVESLEWAELRTASPFPKHRERRSAYKAGLSYERKVGRTLQRMNRWGELDGELSLGQWISYGDANGYGYAQPDAYLLAGDMVLLMEIKLTQTDTAEQQLEDLYRPLLRHIYGQPVVCLQICKTLRYVPQDLVEGPEDLLARPEPGCFTWHYRGDC